MAIAMAEAAIDCRMRFVFIFIGTVLPEKDLCCKMQFQFGPKSGGKRPHPVRLSLLSAEP
jgi:hypothetical protein